MRGGGRDEGRGRDEGLRRGGGPGGRDEGRGGGGGGVEGEFLEPQSVSWVNAVCTFALAEFSGISRKTTPRTAMKSYALC